MGRERRQHERKSCVIPCDLEIGGKKVSGSTRDVSMGGLSIQADVDADQGDVVSVVLHPPRRHDVHVQAIVWHQRRVIQKSSKRELRRVGLVLSEAPPDFHESLGIELPTGPPASKSKPEQKSSSKPKPPPAKPAAKAKPAPPPRTQPTDPPKAPALPKPARYRVRVTMTGKPRTRSILVFAADEGEARSTALGETGSGWEVLEVEKA